MDIRECFSKIRTTRNMGQRPASAIPFMERRPTITPWDQRLQELVDFNKINGHTRMFLKNPDHSEHGSVTSEGITVYSKKARTHH
eukprot:scaffold154063_cov54-Attheya_sp.AAC.2